MVRKTAVACSLIAVLGLTGCAAQMTFREGRDLIAEGRPEEGLGKLQQAAAMDPRSTEYRLAYVNTRDRLVLTYLDQAERLAEAGRISDAEKIFRKVLGIEAANERARAGLKGLEASQRHAAWLKDAEAAWSKNDPDVALAKLRLILTENEGHAAAGAMRRTIDDSRASRSSDATLSAAYKRTITLDFKDVSLKQLFEVIGRTSGLNFAFDKEVKTDQKTSIFLRNSSIEAAVHLALLTNQLERQVLDSNTILIYPNTAAKQKEYQETLVKTFYLTNADAKAVAIAIKTLLKTRDLVTDDKLNMLMMRDTPEAIRLAEKLVALHDVAEPEVMLEVEILEVKRTRFLELGIRWPDSITLTPLPSTSGGTLNVRDLRNLTSDTLGVGIGPASIRARKEDGDTNILANPRIRARNHEKAKILIGERVPNITSTATSTGFISESITYVDVGLKLDVEPTIYLDNEVAIKIALEVSNIVSQVQTKSGSLAYQIGTRTASTVLRLKDGENQVLAGLINDEDRRGAVKVPGLGEVPVLGRLFGSASDDSQKTEIVLSITPRLIRNIRKPDAALAEFRAGTENSLRLRPESGGSTNVAAPLNATLQSKPTPNSIANPSAPAMPSTAAPGESGGGVAGGGAIVEDPLAPTVGAAVMRWQGASQMNVGDTAVLQLTMQSDQPVTGLPLSLQFDNKTLEVTGIAEGDFLRQAGAQTSFTSRVVPNGQVLVSGTRVGNGGATGIGTILSISVRALAPTTASTIQFVTATPVGLQGRAVLAHLPPPYILQILPK